jgi:mono/diheme cytochrome c family protein
MKRIIELTLLVGVLLISAPMWMKGGRSLDFKAEAQPSWSRKYNAKCTLCHTTYPRLNRTGYEFKRLGYRMPQEVTSKEGGTNTASASLLEHQPFVIKPTGYKPKATSDSSEKGRMIFERLNCSGCHAVAGKGGFIGPPLDGVGGRRDSDFLIAHLTNPGEHVKKFPELHGDPQTIMPHPHATPEEIKLLVEYLLTLPEPAGGFLVNPHVHGELPEGPGRGSNYVAAPITDATREGQKQYLDLGCASCHAIGGTGGKFGPPLDGIGARRARQYIIGHITNPQLHAEQFPGEHPAAPIMPATNATAEQIAQIADYLLTLSPNGNDVERPKNRIDYYLGVTYVPAIEVDSGGGNPTTSTFESRNLNIYAAGPVGPNFSFFVQPTLAKEGDWTLGNKFEMVQGLFNYGGSRNYLQLRGGQLFNLRPSGFAGTDRGLTDTDPFIFQPSNGFSTGGLGRGASFEFTFRRWTTFKVFANQNEAPDAGDDESAPVFGRSRTFGFIAEKVLGSKGLSGVQFEFAGGHTPYSVTDVAQHPLDFQRYLFFANKTFVDKRNFERLNIIFGAAVLRDSQFLGIDSDQRSRGFGCFLEADAIPVVNHLTVYGRYDQLRPTTLIPDNTLKGATFAVIYDFVKYARMSFEYQRQFGAQTGNVYRIGWQANF